MSDGTACSSLDDMIAEEKNKILYKAVENLS